MRLVQVNTVISASNMPNHVSVCRLFSYSKQHVSRVSAGACSHSKQNYGLTGQSVKCIYTFWRNMLVYGGLVWNGLIMGILRSKNKTQKVERTKDKG